MSSTGACNDEGCGGVTATPSRERGRWLSIALALVVGTMVYNIAEAVVAITFGAKADSIALFGFGLDSVIECAAASATLWRLAAERRNRSREDVERREQIVRRFVGGTFLALAVYVVVQSGLNLVRRDAPDSSPIGIVLAVASLVVMPAIAIAKLRAAKLLASRALAAEAKETLACSYLSAALLVGLLANATLGWWWADPAAALAMVPWLIKEGREGLRGDVCCDD